MCDAVSRVEILFINVVCVCTYAEMRTQDVNTLSIDYGFDSMVEREGRHWCLEMYRITEQNQLTSFSLLASSSCKEGRPITSRGVSIVGGTSLA